MRVKRPLLLDNINTIAIQIGRTVLSFNVKKCYNLYQFMFKNTEACDEEEKEVSNIRPEHRTTLENILHYQQNRKEDTREIDNHSDRDADLQGDDNNDNAINDNITISREANDDNDHDQDMG